MLPSAKGMRVDAVHLGGVESPFVHVGWRIKCEVRILRDLSLLSLSESLELL
jgi:hypothetical protein